MSDAEAKSITREFFEDMLPLGLRDNRTMFELLRGSICIAVQDEGAWTLVFGKYEEGCFREELDQSADCVMVWEKAGFEKALQGLELGEEDAPKIYGNPDMVESFGRMMDSANKGQLGIRTASH